MHTRDLPVAYVKAHSKRRAGCRQIPGGTWGDGAVAWFGPRCYTKFEAHLQVNVPVHTRYAGFAFVLFLYHASKCKADGVPDAAGKVLEDVGICWRRVLREWFGVVQMVCTW